MTPGCERRANQLQFARPNDAVKDPGGGGVGIATDVESLHYIGAVEFAGVQGPIYEHTVFGWGALRSGNALLPTGHRAALSPK